MRMPTVSADNAATGKYIIKRWFDNKWLLMTPGARHTVYCDTFEFAIRVMDIHAGTGQFADPFDHDKVPGDGNGNGEWDNV